MQTQNGSGSTPNSPKNRIKILCSHGGKILPRPSDGQLKYIGGETRVISVPPDISFQELMKKLTYPIDGEMILKYQVASEDLDALVTVKCDEDVRYMRDEIERQGNAGNSRLRAFLFPAPNTIEKENPVPSSCVNLPHALEQRYIDAINGIARTTGPKHQHLTVVTTVQQHSLLGSTSTCSSPTSPNNEACVQNNTYHHHSGRMTSTDRVRSSPNISSMNVAPQQSHHLVHQQPPPQPSVQQYVLHYPPGGSAYQSSPKLHTGGERRLISVRSVGRADGVRYQWDATASPHYHVATQNRLGRNGSCLNSGHAL